MKTLFVLDDDEMFHRLIELSFVKSNPFKNIYHYYEVSVLVDYLRKHSTDTANLPDVIFVDINLPIIDGWGFLDSLEEIYDKLSKKITIYIVTVSVRIADKERAATYPFVKEFIIKPIYTKKLMDIALAAGDEISY